MADSRIVAFVPVHGISERVPEKEWRRFAGIEGGLTAIKMGQLAGTSGLNGVRVSIPMNAHRQDLIMAAERGMRESLPVEFLAEPDHRRGTDGLIAWVPEALANEPDDTVVLFTHVTSPFFDAPWYEKAIAAYRSRVGRGFDSLMACFRLQDFFWGSSGPINWNRKKKRWPRTQDLQPFHLIHSACFMAPLKVYRDQGDRIGRNPFLFVTGRLAGLGIDWPEDWEIAEALWAANPKQRLPDDEAA